MNKEFLEKQTSQKPYNAYPSNNKLTIANRKKNIEKDTNSAEDYVNSGFIYLENKDYDEALECFQKITELEPNNPKTFINLGYVYEKMDMFDSAKKCYEKALKIKDDNIEAIIKIGHILELQMIITML